MFKKVIQKDSLKRLAATQYIVEPPIEQICLVSKILAKGQSYALFSQKHFVFQLLELILSHEAKEAYDLFPFNLVDLKFQHVNLLLPFIHPLSDDTILQFSFWDLMAILKSLLFLLFDHFLYFVLILVFIFFTFTVL